MNQCYSLWHIFQKMSTVLVYQLCQISMYFILHFTPWLGHVGKKNASTYTICFLTSQHERFLEGLAYLQPWIGILVLHFILFQHCWGIHHPQVRPWYIWRLIWSVMCICHFLICLLASRACLWFFRQTKFIRIWSKVNLQSFDLPHLLNFFHSPFCIKCFYAAIIKSGLVILSVGIRVRSQVFLCERLNALSD